MSQIKRIAKLPDWEWLPHSAKEVTATDQALLVKQTDIVWRIGDFAICGFVYSTYISPPWLWFLIAKKIDLKNLFELKSLAHRIPSGTTTAVEVGYGIGEKFAKLFGFEKLPETTAYQDLTYILYRRK